MKIHNIELKEKFYKYNKEFIEKLKASDLYVEVINFDFEDINLMSYLYYEHSEHCNDLKKCLETTEKNRTDRINWINDTNNRRR
ncbi:hypothetical protein CRU96_12745 [Malaciobacter halophilus]|nr:hypothetical protein [Malaciobacter halophilus]RYA22486.1 hypothetical protein CRU96_12745 [Malaciobacter halophilus]